MRVKQRVKGDDGVMHDHHMDTQGTHMMQALARGTVGPSARTMSCVTRIRASWRVWRAATTVSVPPHPSSWRVRASTSHFSTDGSSSVEVVFVDPRVVLTSPQQLKPEDLCALRLPASLVSQLHQGHMELGDADDPLNAWLWGERAEIFEYTLVGSHPTRSGFASVIARHELDKIASGSPPPLSWDMFLKHTAGERTTRPPHPFLFAGRILESSHASLYVLKGSEGRVTGLMLSSQSADQDD